MQHTRFRQRSVTLIGFLVLGGCRAILGIESRPDLPGEGEDTGEAGRGDERPTGDLDGGLDGADGSRKDANPVDLDWAPWTVPALSPDPSTFVVLPEVVTDPSTGLMWDRQTSGRIPFADAVPWCTARGAGGFADWRVPRWIELLSIVDYTVKDPSISATLFPATPNDLQWSISAYLSPLYRMGFALHEGRLMTIPPEDLQTVVRCVRGAPPSGVENTAPAFRYTIEESIVRDMKTGLVWQRERSPDPPMATGAATAYCAALALGPFGSGWRVPNIKELLTTFDPKSVSQPRWYQPAFGVAETRKLWSSTRLAGSSGYVWSLDFAIMDQSPEDESVYTHAVRCVHD